MKKIFLVIIAFLFMFAIGYTQDARLKSLTTTGTGNGLLTLWSSTGGGSVGLEAPDSTTSNANIVWKLPAADSSGCLSSNGSGNMSLIPCSNSGATYISVNCVQTSVQAGDTLTAPGAFATECKIPANTLAVGSVIHARLSGITATAASTATFQFAFKMCQVQGCGTGTVVSFGVDNQYTQNASLNNQPFRMRGDFPITAIGTLAGVETQYDTIKTSGASPTEGFGGGGNSSFDSTVDEYFTGYLNTTPTSGNAKQRALVVWVTH